MRQFSAATAVSRGTDVAEFPRLWRMENFAPRKLCLYMLTSMIIYDVLFGEKNKFWRHVCNIRKQTHFYNLINSCIFESGKECGKINFGFLTQITSRGSKCERKGD